MSNLMEKISQNRTRPAQIDGENVLVKVYSEKELKKFGEKMTKQSEQEMADFWSDQFLYENGEKIFTSDFLLSEKCPNVFTLELANLFREVNSGTYKKK